mmetsp:Transcript_137838/g.358119  ORF Transcript_137838/g.358119 Transcript_137838/m.358119 type:complete len:395 (+) Transcript_137838:768-1952(+)
MRLDHRGLGRNLRHLSFKPRAQFLLASHHLDFHEGLSEADRHLVGVLLEGLGEVHDHLPEVADGDLRPQRRGGAGEVLTTKFVHKHIYEFDEIAFDVVDFAVVRRLGHLDARVRQAEAIDGFEKLMQALGPGFCVFLQMLWGHVLLLVFFHLLDALAESEPVLVVGPIADQQLQAAEWCLLARQLVADRLCEGADVVQSVKPVLVDPILDVENQLGRKQSCHPENCRHLRLGQLVVPAALRVHQQQRHLPPGLVGEDEGLAPEPDALRAAVLPIPPLEAAPRRAGRRALRDPMLVALEEPRRRRLRRISFRPEAPPVFRRRPRRRCRRLLAACHHRCRRQWLFATGGGFCSGRLDSCLSFLLSLDLCHLCPQISHEQVQKKALACPVSTHDRED